MNMRYRDTPTKIRRLLILTSVIASCGHASLETPRAPAGSTRLVETFEDLTQARTAWTVVPPTSVAFAAFVNGAVRLTAPKGDSDFALRHRFDEPQLRRKRIQVSARAKTSKGWGPRCSASNDDDTLTHLR